MKVISKALVVIALSAAAVSPAFAGGFLGNLIEQGCGGCGVGRALDRANEQLGKPAEQIGGAVMQSYGVPLSARCATPYGLAIGAFLPVGGPCMVNGVPGVVIN